MVKPHRQPAVSLARDRVIVDHPRDGDGLTSQAGGQLDSRCQRATPGPEEQREKGQPDERREVPIDEDHSRRQQDSQHQPRDQRAHQCRHHDAGAPRGQQGGKGPPGQRIQLTVSDFASSL